VTPALREKLILENLPVAEAIAHRLLLSVPPLIELDDLLGAARLSLIEAVDSWRAIRSPLNWWIKLRVRAALVDLVRRSGPCGQRSETRDVVSEKYRPLKDVYRQIVEEDAFERDNSHGPCRFHRRTIDPFPDPPEIRSLFVDARLEPLQSALQDLPPRQRKILQLVYASERSPSGELRRIGRERRFRIGWRRVLREHDAALEALRHAMATRTA
jgi:RNA polymerase sigma factor (sigma-70 family)